MRIQHEVLNDQRAEYGEQVIKNLAKELTATYGRGFSRNNLYRFVSFYKSFPNLLNEEDGGDEIVTSVMGQSEIIPSVMGLSEKSDLYASLRPTKPIRLSWTHYGIFLQELTLEGRIWYENEAAKEMWSTRTLQRNVSSKYYHRLLQSQDKEVVRDEMKELTKPLQDKLEYFKSPIVAEFLNDQRAEYGEQVVNILAKELTAKYKTGFTKTNLYNYIGFFEAWPNFFHAVSGKLLQSLTAKCPIRLSWTHYNIIRF